MEDWIPNYANIFLSVRIRGFPCLALSSCRNYGFVCPDQIDLVLKELDRSVSTDMQTGRNGHGDEQEMDEEEVRAVADGEDGVHALQIDYMSAESHFLPSGLNVSFADVVKSLHENNQPVVTQPGGRPE